MGKITVVGIGPGDVNLLTLEAYEKLNESTKLIFKTAQHPVYDYFESKGKALENLDRFYDECADFDSLNSEIKMYLEKQSEKGNIIYCVLGNPSEDDEIAIEWLNEGADIDIISGISYVSYAGNYVEMDPNLPMIVNNIFDLSKHRIDIHSNHFITNAYDSMLISDMVWLLSELLGDEYEIYLLNKVGIKSEISVMKIRLMELLERDDYDHQTIIFIPGIQKGKRYDLGDLCKIVETLRSENGCPWDLEQTHESIKNNLLEEAYEVIEAINNDDFDNFEEELGDVLFQIIFHSQLADEEGYFNIGEVINKISLKMIYRHPHVFSENSKIDTENVLEQWENLKDIEKGVKNYTERLLNVPKVLPSLLKSYKIQKKASKIGFDWENINGPIDKMKEELDEVIEAINHKTEKDILEEIGDLLFSIVNVSRFLDINPEMALNNSVDKFIERFEFIENKSLELNRNLEDMTLEEMDMYWEESKKLLN